MAEDNVVKQIDKVAAIAYLNEIAGLYGSDAITDIRDNHPAVVHFALHRMTTQTHNIKEIAKVLEKRYLAAIYPCNEHWYDMAAAVVEYLEDETKRTSSSSN